MFGGALRVLLAYNAEVVELSKSWQKKVMAIIGVEHGSAKIETRISRKPSSTDQCLRRITCTYQYGVAYSNNILFQEIFAIVLVER